MKVFYTTEVSIRQARGTFTHNPAVRAVRLADSLEITIFINALKRFDSKHLM